MPFASEIKQLIEILSNIRPFMAQLFSAFLGAGLASAILTNWFEKKRIEKLKRDESIESVVKLLSEWVKSNYTGDHSNKAHWKLQSIYWETVLRLDYNVLEILIPLFANNGSGLTVEEVIVKCRQLLLKLNAPDIKAEDLNKWLPEDHSKSLPIVTK